MARIISVMKESPSMQVDSDLKQSKQVLIIDTIKWQSQ